ncbi:unnamed protein product [Amaranthus hypochondriacus]
MEGFQEKQTTTTCSSASLPNFFNWKISFLHVLFNYELNCGQSLISIHFLHSFWGSFDFHYQEFSLAPAKTRVVALNSIEETVKNLGAKYEKLVEMMKRMEKHASSSRNAGENDILGPPPSTQNQVMGCIPKLDFPIFDGKTPRTWIRKANKYFQLCKIREEQKIDFASIHMIGKAEAWLDAYMAARMQEGALKDYLNSFEESKSLMIQETPQIPESFFLNSFIGGLNPSLKHFVQALNPRSLYSAVEYARLKQKNDDAMRMPNSSKPSVPQHAKKPFLDYEPSLDRSSQDTGRPQESTLTNFGKKD